VPRPRWALLPWIVLLLAVTRTASAQDGLVGSLRTILDTSFSTATTTTTNASGLVSVTKANTFYPRVTVDSETFIFPAVRFSVGGVFDVSKSSATTDGTDSSSTLTRLRPHIVLRSTNPTLSPSLAYYRRENLSSTPGVPSSRLVSEDYIGNLGWRPEGLPQFDAQFIRTNSFDGDRAAQDLTRDYGSMQTRYQFKHLDTYYTFGVLNTSDHLRQRESHQITNSVRLNHSQAFFNRRAQWNATYHVNRQRLSLESSNQSGQSELPVVAFTGLSALNDAPPTAVLSSTPALVDGNLTASTGINLGLIEIGSNTQARNIGLDFSVPSEVNRLQLWIDRELPSNISTAFSWEIYSSNDNITWSRETVISTAPFGPLENRFRIDFRTIAARYLKVVTRPLSGAVVDATRYPEIFVTELEAFLVGSSGNRGTLSRTAQNLNADLRVRLLDAAGLYYEGSYWMTDVTNGRERDTLSNGVSMTRRFNRFVSAFARAAYETGSQTEGRRTATVTNATVTVDPLRTLSASLLYSGLNERVAGRPEDRKGVALRTTAQVYQGVDLIVGFGVNVTTRYTGERFNDRSLTVGTTITPRRDLSLTLNYNGGTTTRTGVFTGIPQLHTRTGYATLTYDPFRTLHLVVAEELVAITGEKTRTTHNIGANWTPLPDGALQLTLAYNESVRPLEFGTERNFRPGIRWLVSRRSYIDVYYQRISSAFVSHKTNTKVFSVDVKVFL